MEITFHQARRDATLEARGLDFADAGKVFVGPELTLEDDRRDYGEPRFQTYGLLNDRLVVVVWSPRGDIWHVFSMRYCNDRGPGSSKPSFVDPDDGPEWTEEQFARAQLSIGGEVVRPATGTMARGRGRPRLPHAKQHVSLRLEPKVIEAYKSTGPGWQARMAEALRKAVGL